jgi:hypothetical protein
MNKTELIDKLLHLGNTTEMCCSTDRHKAKELAHNLLDEYLKAINFTDSSLQLPYKDEKLIENMCISFRHDYGLLDSQAQELLRFECKEWLIAYENNK